MVNDFIVEKIIEYRKRKGWSQSRMAMELHVSFSTLQRYEQDKRDVPINVAERISELYGLTLPELLRGMYPEGEKKQQFLDAVWEAHKRCFETVHKQ